ncbi:MAG: Clp1/GlmU family protein [Acidobacteriota bacterium]
MVIEIPSAWEEIAKLCLKNKLRRILVLGASDRGKSTLCRFLVSRIGLEGAPAVLVDSDVGQKDVGPPAAVTRGHLQRPSDLHSLRMDGLYFVGATTPVRHLLPMVVGTREVTRSAGDAFVIINTTGLIQGIGYALKSYKIETLHPDLLIAVDPGDETAAITASYPQFRSIRVEPSPAVVAKSRPMRREARQRAFAVYFGGSSRVGLDLASITFQRNAAFVDALRHGAQSAASLPQRHLLCGLCDGAGRCLGLGLLEKLDMRAGTMAVITPVKSRGIKIVQLGDLYVSPNGEELGWTR